MSKGQSQAGEANGYAKLTAEEVVEMRALYATHKVTKAALARRYNISQSHVCSIVTRKAWRHLP
jgi:DNA-binding transcriptional regulator LsrR (DeoR family)